MKAVRYIISLAAVWMTSLALFSCMDEEIRKDGFQGDGKSVYVSISAPQNEVINPFTKSVVAESQSVKNLSIWVFDEGGDLLTSELITSGLEELGKTEGTTITRSIEVGKGRKGSVCVVANAVDSNNEADLKAYWKENPVSDISDLDALRFGLDASSSTPQKVMYASPVAFSVDDATSKVDAKLIRIYSMVTVVVKRGTTMDKIVTVTPQTLTLYNVPKEGRLTEDNLITKEAESVKTANGLVLTNGADAPAQSWNISDHEKGGVLYLYENRQPTGFCQTRPDGKQDQTSKTPKSFSEATTSTSLLLTDYRSSYIEIKAKYMMEGSDKEGAIKYRFFLGKDAYTNFDVQRNVHYKITLTLEGNGGIDEATWRVETDNIPYQLNLSEVFVGYREKSYVDMVVTGDVKAISGTSFGKASGPNPEQGTFSVLSERLEGDKYIVRIQADATNVHDFEKKAQEVIFTMLNGSTQKTYIRQVPRLVDPIAIYKSATNEKAVNITVREYNPDATPTHGAYIPLASKGKWSATAQSSSSGDWYTIYLLDESGVKIEGTEVGLGETIVGEGEVRFGYKPRNANTATDGDAGSANTARTGMILVKYHNAWCEHEIFLRQGYQPTEFMSGYGWSAYNVGKPNENTKSPTETGWLFNGGCNIGIHPFRPAYRDLTTPVIFSDGTTGKLGDKGASSTAWKTNPKGPCPEGYIVPQAQVYRNMTKKTTVYTGYVYDDDLPSPYGWKWGADGNAEIDETMHCNPAKGSLFVEKSGDNNLFFGYGKGLNTGITKESRLVWEIGIGRRFNNLINANWSGGLSYNDYTETPNNHNYGGFYWNASDFNKSTHLGKVDFGYDIFRREPNLIDVPGEPASEGGPPAEGIDVKNNASFVRCVKVQNKRIEIKATFKKSISGSISTYQGSVTVWMDNQVNMNPDVNKLGVFNTPGGSIEIPPSVGTVSLVGEDRYNIYTAHGVSVQDLSDENKVIILKY